MKALSIRQPWASLIVNGDKTVECRSWKTPYRGELLVCASRGDVTLDDGLVLPGGLALGVVELYDIRRMKRSDAEAAFIPDEYIGESLGDYAWLVRPVRLITPVPVKGRLHIYEVDTTGFTDIPDRFADHFEYLRWRQHMPYLLKDGTESEDYGDK